MVSDADLAYAAGLTVPVLKAIQAVESGGSATSIRFEPHVFLRARPELAGQVPYTPGYTGCRISRAASCVGSETNRAAFERAYALDARAAVRATSWGTYQVLGGHLLALYENDPENAVAGFWANPAEVSKFLLVAWMRDNPRAVQAANERDWYGFVHRFNGCTDCDAYLARFLPALEQAERAGSRWGVAAAVGLVAVALGVGAALGAGGPWSLGRRRPARRRRR